jgi:ATP-dependent helicase/nuclease subunit A
VTAEGKARGTLCTNAVADAGRHRAVLAEEQGRLLAFHRRAEALVLARRTAALLRLGHAVIAEYERLKRRGRLLDFET